MNVARIVLATVATVCGASACSLSLAHMGAPQGGGVLAGLGFRSTGGAVSAIQFDVEADPRLLKVGFAVGAGPRAVGKSMTSYSPSPGVTRFVVWGLNASRLPDEALVQLLIGVAGSPRPGGLPLSITGLTCASPSGDEVQGAPLQARVEVLPGEFASRLQAENVRNAASLRPGPVAPGSAASLFGPLLAESEAAEVFFDDNPAAVLFSSPGQVNVIVPQQAKPPFAVVRVYVGGELRGLADVPVSDAAPALFTLDGSGAGAALARFDDGGSLSEARPAAPGEALTFFVTGGRADAPWSAAFNGAPGEVLSVESLPGWEGAVLAVRVVTPASSLLVPSCLVVLSSGSAATQSEVVVYFRL